MLLYEGLALLKGALVHALAPGVCHLHAWARHLMFGGEMEETLCLQRPRNLVWLQQLENAPLPSVISSRLQSFVYFLPLTDPQGLEMSDRG